MHVGYRDRCVSTYKTENSFAPKLSCDVWFIIAYFKSCIQKLLLFDFQHRISQNY